MYALARGLLGRCFAPAPAVVASAMTSPWSQLLRRHAGSKSRTGRMEHMRFGPTRRKGRYYYRFHKMLGKGNWRKYIERYLPPPKMENMQRFIPTPYASYHQARDSHSWFWRLPKAIANSTTSDEVLNAWVQFRHKHPKRIHHYMMAVRKLVKVGGCEPGDWRFRLIATRLDRGATRVINKPKLAYFYAKLNSTKDVENLSRFMYPMIPRYDAGQLVFIARAFGMIRLSDKYMFQLIAEYINLAELSVGQLVHLAEAYANCEVGHYILLNRISAEVQTRGTSTLLSLQPLANLAQAFAKSKLQDWALLELCTHTARISLAEGSFIDPTDLATLCRALRKLKCNDVEFFQHVLRHIDAFGYDYPADVLCDIGMCAVHVLGHHDKQNRRSFRRIFNIVSPEVHLLSLQATTNLACLAHHTKADPREADKVVGLVRARISHKLPNSVPRNDGKEKFDIASLFHVLSLRGMDDVALSKMCRHLHRQLQHFEVIDFLRTSRALAKLASPQLDVRVVKAMKKWIMKRRAEFSDKDFEYIQKYYTTLFEKTRPLTE